MTDRGKASRRWGRRGGALVALGLAAAASAFVAWPYVLRAAAEAALSEGGARVVHVGAASLNLANGRAELRDVTVGGDGSPAARIGRLAVDLNLRSLWQKRIRLDSAILRDADIEIRRLADGRMRVAGFDLPTGGPAPGAAGGWAIGVDAAEIAEVRVVYRDGDTVQRLTVGRFSVADLAPWRGDAGSPVAFEGKWGVGALRVTGKMSPFSAGSRGAFDIKVDGLPVAPLAVPARAAGLPAMTGDFSADLRLTLATTADGVSAVLSGDATLQGLAVTGSDGEPTTDETGETGLTADQFQVRNLHAEGAAGPDGWTLALRLDAAARRAVVRAAGIAVDGDLLRWSGDIAVEAPRGADPAVTATGQVDGTQLVARWADDGVEFLAVDDARVGTVAVDRSGAVRAGDIAVRGGRAGLAGSAEESAPPIAWADLTVDDALVSPARRIDVRQVKIVGLDMRVRRRADGRVDWPWVFGAKGPAEDGDAPADDPAPDVAIEEITVEGGRLAYRDGAVTPQLNIVADPVSLRLSGLDSHPAAPPAVLVVNAAFGANGRARIEGTIRPFAAPTSFELTGRLADIELPILSPYMDRYLGYEIGRGRLSADIEAAVADNKIRAKNDLTIGKLTLKPRGGKDGETVQADIGVPLTTAVSLLRNSDDVIRLSVPVEGDLDNPRFDFSDAVNTALGNALKTTVTTTLNVLFPITGILTVVQLAGESHLRFPPLSFPAGGAEIVDEGGYFTELAGLMQKRPAVAISLCGKAVEPDRAALAAANAKAGARRQPVDDDALRQLAEKRAAAVLRRLSAGYGIARERFFLCAPEIDSAAAAAPRVEVLL